MRYLVLEKETSVAEIAGKAYRNLPTAERRKAEEALVKANPELKNMANVRAGALIRIPEGAATGNLDRRNVVDPVDHLIDGVGDQLKALENEMRAGFAAFDERMKEYPQLIKAAEKEAEGRPEVTETIAELTKHLKASKKDHEKNREMGLAALKSLQEVAATLARR